MGRSPTKGCTQRIHGFIVGSRRQQTELVRAIEATGIKPVIDRSFAMAEIADAFQLQKAGGHFEKIGLEF